MKKLLAIFVAALAAIGLEAHLASAARTCNSVITPGEGLAKAAANCPPSTTFIIKDGAYKLPGPIDVDSGDTFKGTYSDGSLPTINAQRGGERLRRQRRKPGDDQVSKAVCNDIGPLLLTASCASVWRVPKLPALCLTANIAGWSNCTDYRSRAACSADGPLAPCPYERLLR